MDKALYDRIIASVGIVDVMRAYGLDLVKKGRDFWCRCPFHDDHKPSFNVSPSKNICKCFSCGKPAMTPLQFIAEKEGVSKGEALQIMADIGNICVPERIGGMPRFSPVKHYECDRERRSGNAGSEEYVDRDVMARSCNETFWPTNPLYSYLCSVHPKADVDQVFAEYHVGTSKYKVNPGQGSGNSVVFWQIDCSGVTRAGKIVPYRPDDGHRIKDEKGKDLSWVHSALKKTVAMRQCLFGLHLLARPHRTIYIVESEKTALEMRLRYLHAWPQAVWLATGGKGGGQRVYDALSHLLFAPVTLCPDADAWTDWQKIQDTLAKDGVFVSIDSTLVKHGVAPGSKADIADFSTQAPMTFGDDEEVDKCKFGLRVGEIWSKALTVIEDLVPDARLQLGWQDMDIAMALQQYEQRGE